MAVKVIRHEQDSGSTSAFCPKRRTDSVTNELNAKDLKHENIVEIFGVYPDPQGNSVIIMEYVGKNNLQTLMDSHSDYIDEAFQHK